MTWSVMSEPKYGSTPETTKLARFDRILLGPCTDILRAILAIKMDPSLLSNKVRAFVGKLSEKKTNPFKETENIIYRGDYSMFDITLLYSIFRNVCNIQPHVMGWGKPPNPLDRSVSANIERIRIIRNDRGHYANFGIPDDQYKNLCTDIYTILSELGNDLGNWTNSLKKTITFVESPTKLLESVNEIMNITMDPEQEYELNIKKQVLEKDLKCVKGNI